MVTSYNDDMLVDVCVLKQDLDLIPKHVSETNNVSQPQMATVEKRLHPAPSRKSAKIPPGIRTGGFWPEFRAKIPLTFTMVGFVSATSAKIPP